MRRWTTTSASCAKKLAANEQIANLSPEPSSTLSASSSARAGGGGFMKRLVKAAVDSGPRRSAISNRDGRIRKIPNEMRHHEKMRQAWGRARWPLLVAARSFGDPTMTQGKYVRPPQGTADLNFPVYPATWYDNKQLMNHRCNAIPPIKHPPTHSRTNPDSAALNARTSPPPSHVIIMCGWGGWWRLKKSRFQAGGIFLCLVSYVHTCYHHNEITGDEQQHIYINIHVLDDEEFNSTDAFFMKWNMDYMDHIAVVS